MGLRHGCLSLAQARPRDHRRHETAGPHRPARTRSHDAEWSEFDPDAGPWKIPAARTKKERAHLGHLAAQAIAILEELKPFTGNARHVFDSPLRPGPLRAFG